MPASKVPIYAALFANIAISITKFIAAGVTGSSAMISEGIHSAVDSMNEVLLLYGIKRSKKEADETRPFGYGKELYFWAFIVSILIFAIGGGISFYEGVSHIQHPEPIEDPYWNYIVLGIAFVLDGISFITAVREFNRQRGSTSFWKAVKKSKDPSTFVVLFEDAADVLGLTVAFLGVYLGYRFQSPVFDGVASILIGIILTSIAIMLARESRSLLMGESADKKTLQSIVDLTRENQGVERVSWPMSMYLSPEEIVLVLTITFSPDLTSLELSKITDNIKRDIQNTYPDIKQLFIQPETTLKH